MKPGRFDQLAMHVALVTSRRQVARGLIGATLGAVVGAKQAAAYDDPRLVVLAPPSTGPKLSGIGVTGITATSAVVVWSTSEPADSTVEYGATADLGQAVADPALVTAHRVALSGLTPATTYHYRVRSRNANGTHATRADRTFTTAGHGLIAFVGPDGNMWLTDSDGANQRSITSEIFSEHDGFGPPRWSHDGTMLVFERWSEPAGIFRYEVASQTDFPIELPGCGAPAFTARDDHLLLGCLHEGCDPDRPVIDLATDPSLGFVSESDLDGGDWRVAIPFDNWPCPGHYAIYEIDVAADGALLLLGVGMAPHLMLYAADGTKLTDFPGWHMGGRFAVDGASIVVSRCDGECYHNRGPYTYTYARLDRTGNTLEEFIQLPAGTLGGTPTVSPDGRRMAFSTFDPNGGSRVNGTISVMDLPDGEPVPIAIGAAPAWQPIGAATG